MSVPKMLKFFNEEFPGEFIKIDDIRILENFSFLSVSPDDSEMILKHFGKKAKGSGRKTLVSKAKS
jgi:hypothetical protein